LSLGHLWTGTETRDRCVTKSWEWGKFHHLLNNFAHEAISVTLVQQISLRQMILIPYALCSLIHSCVASRVTLPISILPCTSMSPSPIVCLYSLHSITMACPIIRSYGEYSRHIFGPKWCPCNFHLAYKQWNIDGVTCMTGWSRRRV
jgi:hypothetical protein